MPSLIEWEAPAFRVDELLRQLADPNLHDIPRNLSFRVEMWEQSDQRVRWMIAASASVAIGHAAMDTGIANYPDQRFTLRNGILVVSSIRVTSSATVLEKRCAGSERQRHLCRQQDACAHQHDAERIKGWYFEHFGSAH
jgi:hypothetical protein